MLTANPETTALAVEMLDIAELLHVADYDLREYEREHEPSATNAIVVNGVAGGGKGTLAKAIREALDPGGEKSIVVNQGLAFRSLTYLALEDGVDLTEDDRVTGFLGAHSTKLALIDMQTKLGTLEQGEIEDLLYVKRISDVVKFVGRNNLSHPLAVGTMFDKVAGAADAGIKTAVLDGRSLDRYARAMESLRLGKFIGSFFVHCDPEVAAMRIIGETRQYDDLDTVARLKVADRVHSLSSRNLIDAQRPIDPLRTPERPYCLDLLKGLPECPQERETVFDEIESADAVYVDNGVTTCKEQLTDPIAAVVREMARRAEIAREFSIGSR